jgi:hypothetical protein
MSVQESRRRRAPAVASATAGRRWRALQLDAPPAGRGARAAPKPGARGAPRSPAPTAASGFVAADFGDEQDDEAVKRVSAAEAAAQDEKRAASAAATLAYAECCLGGPLDVDEVDPFGDCLYAAIKGQQPGAATAPGTRNERALSHALRTASVAAAKAPLLRLLSTPQVSPRRVS